MTKSEIKNKFDELLPLYTRLADNVKNALIQFLDDLKIDYLDVEFRVKDFKSFYEKIERKNYKNPFEDIQDFCGLRIILYYPSDLDIITELINKEFNVSESVDKQEELEDDRFGYRSYHFIATLKDEWMVAPNYRNLNNLNFEIQARTILMHGWAAINHKLLYKHEKDIPKPFKRNLFRLSALIELADEQFEILRTERQKYEQGTIIKSEDGEIIIDKSKTLNVDSLRALLKSYFPERDGEEFLSDLVEMISKNDLDLNQFHDKLTIALPYLDKIESEEFEANIDIYEEMDKWNLYALIITILDLTIDNHLENMNHQVEIYEITNKYREKLRNS
jgi:ppGpp synthetase/RelA/SpoT-type nucleotidyltranferase